MVGEVTLGHVEATEELVRHARTAEKQLSLAGLGPILDSRAGKIPHRTETCAGGVYSFYPFLFLPPLPATPGPNCVFFFPDFIICKNEHGSYSFHLTGFCIMWVKIINHSQKGARLRH